MAARERQKVLIYRDGRQVGSTVATVDPDDEDGMYEAGRRWMQAERYPDGTPGMSISAGSGFSRREVDL